MVTNFIASFMLFFIFVVKVVLTIKKLFRSYLFLLVNDNHGMHMINYVDSNNKDVYSFNIVSPMHKAIYC